MLTKLLSMKRFLQLLLFLFSISVSAQIPDTVYSNTVTSNILLDGFAFDSANISYTLIDSLNGNQLLIRQATSDSLGKDIVDSLPVIKNAVGINPIYGEDINNWIYISNNGTGSNHLIRFKTDAKTVSKEAHIVNVLGQEIAIVPLKYNSQTKTYDAIWKGENEKKGAYLFYANTEKGPLAKKIIHLANTPSAINFDAGFNEKREENDFKSTRDEVLAASKYAIGISHGNLETLLDTVLVKESTFHDFIFNVNGIQYEDGDVMGWIEFADLTGAPTNADVEYKRFYNQSEIYTTTAPNGFYELTVPVVFEQQNPGQTKYIVTLTENGGSSFITEIDTVLVVPGNENLFQHYINQTPPPNTEQDFEGIIRQVYTKLPESGVTIRVINRTTNELIEEDITGSDGAYSFLDIPAGTLVEFELGKPGELWMVNNEFDIPDEVIDTLKVMNRYFYPKTVEVPEVGTNTTFEGDGEEIAEMVGSDYINFEEILRDTDNMWANGPGTAYWSARTWIENNFYEGNSPITTVNTERNITNTMQTYYEPYTNFYSGQLGWNVNFNSGNLTIPLIATTTYGVFAIIGGEIMTTGGLEEYIKELQGRRLFLGSVNSRPSMMNSDPEVPDEKDRAYVYLILINQDGRFDTDQETYSLENLTSTEPTMKTYKDIPGNKPHSKKYFNWQKFAEQMEAEKNRVMSTK